MPDATVPSPDLYPSSTGPGWHPNAQVPYPPYQVLPQAPQAPQENRLLATSAQATYGPGMESQPRWPAPQSAPSDVLQAGFHPYGNEDMYPRRTVLHPPVTYGRPLLPRTEGLAVPSQPAYGSQRILRPQMPVPQSPRTIVSNVSTVSGVPHGFPLQVPARFPNPAGGPPSLVSYPSSSVPVPGPELATLHRESGPENTSEGPTSYYTEPSAEDFNTFFRFDPEEQPTSPASTRSGVSARCTRDQRTDPPYSFSPGCMSNLAISPNATTLERKPLAPKPEETAIPTNQDSPALTPSLVSENDEGRHRNHPLYSEGPQADGLYHCPFESDPNCQHKPTKLKCNYEYETSTASTLANGLQITDDDFFSTQQVRRLPRQTFPMQGRGVRETGVLVHRMSPPTRKRSTRYAWTRRPAPHLLLSRLRARNPRQRLST